jgi:hypothetical protein
METDELRGIAEDARAQLQRARRLWLRRYVRNRVDEELEPGALTRALEELRSTPEDPESRRPTE